MILITGGTGFIGSHAYVALDEANRDLIILDNFCNSREGVLNCLERICGHRPRFVRGDMRDSAVLNKIFAEHHIEAVIHFAGLKAVGESVN